MATRVYRRVAEVLGPIELPSIETPQYVDRDGYEIDAQAFAVALEEAGGPAEDGHTGFIQSDISTEIVAEGPVDNEEENEIMAEGEAAEEGEEGTGDAEPEMREPLLSLSDR